MKAVNRLGLRGALVATFACVVLAGATNPAPADAARYWIQSKEDRRLCLTDWIDGDVELDWCAAGNLYHQWEIWNGGWTRNVATGRCLRAVTIISPIIYSSACSQTDAFEFWRNWFGGWYQRIGNSQEGPRCLSRLPGDPYEVTSVACVNPTGWHHPRELWNALNLG